MAEEQNLQSLSQNQLELLKKLAAIGSDLWGGTAEAPEGKPANEPPKQPEPAPEKKTDIRDIWKTADETVDWTDALAHSTPSDGLTGKRLWSFYHRIAGKVLAGDLNAYTEVLKTANPLGDLTDFSDGINMSAPTAERLESTFVCRDDLMKEDGKLYLAGMGLRIARDLLACLPVSEVRVTAEQDGREVFSATYPRQQLLHRNFSFIDPIRLAEECGAQFG